MFNIITTAAAEAGEWVLRLFKSFIVALIVNTIVLCTAVLIVWLEELALIQYPGRVQFILTVYIAGITMGTIGHFIGSNEKKGKNEEYIHIP